MNSKRYVVFWAVMILMSGQAVLADTYKITTTTTQTTTGRAPLILESSPLPAPPAPMVIVTPAGKATIVESSVTVERPVTKVVQTTTRYSVSVPSYSYLIDRRNDLIGRVTVERDSGALSAVQAQAFLDTISAIDARRLALPSDNSVKNWREVKKLYTAYDRLSDQLKAATGLGDNELAASYRIMSF